MKSKLLPLSLLIPAVVLAQPISQAPAPQSPNASVMQNPALNPADDAKAAIAIKALNDAKKKSSSDDLVKSSGDVGDGKYKYKVYSQTSTRIYSCENKDSYSTKTCTTGY